jgi:hypothetical protein
MKRIIDRKRLIDQANSLNNAKPYTQLPLKNRIRAMLSMYAWDELLDLSEKAGTPAVYNMKGKRGKKEVVPGVMAGDLILLRLLKDAVSGSDSAAKLLLSYGYGNPETAVTLQFESEMEAVEIDDVDISPEEQIELLRKYHGKTIEISKDDVRVDSADVVESGDGVDTVPSSGSDVSEDERVP